MSEKSDQDASGGAEGGMEGGSAGGPGQEAGRGNSLKDLSDETVREMEKRKDGSGHAGTGDPG